MTKAEFVEKLAEATKTTKKQAEQMFFTFVETIHASLQKAERIFIPGLGTFSSVQRKARTGRNPRTGATIKIPARKAVKFSVSSTLSASVNGKKKTSAKPAAAGKAVRTKPKAKKAAVKPKKK
jgi:DNA-binding protein HU-beta